MITFKADQELYFVPTYSEPKIVTITKVGRKFLTVKLVSREYRVYIDTLIVDGNGYNSPGRCYLSKEEHDKQRYVKDLWDSIRDKFNTFSLPDWATVDNLSKIKELIEK